MKQFVTEVLMEFQKGQITLQEAADRHITEKAQHRKASSNRRLKSMGSALQRERNPAKVRELKDWLSQEFYHGDLLQPLGDWFKAFEDFTLCGEGELIRTLLTRMQSPIEEELF